MGCLGNGVKGGCVWDKATSKRGRSAWAVSMCEDWKFSEDKKEARWGVLWGVVEKEEGEERLSVAGGSEDSKGKIAEGTEGSVGSGEIGGGEGGNMCVCVFLGGGSSG